MALMQKSPEGWILQTGSSSNQQSHNYHCLCYFLSSPPGQGTVLKLPLKAKTAYSNHEYTKKVALFLTQAAHVNPPAIQYRAVLCPDVRIKTRRDETKRTPSDSQRCWANVLTRQEAQMLYHAIYLPSMTYPMAVTHMKAVECHQVETEFLQALLPWMGFPRSMSTTAIRHAAASWGRVPYPGGDNRKYERQW